MFCGKVMGGVEGLRGREPPHLHVNKTCRCGLNESMLQSGILGNLSMEVCQCSPFSVDLVKENMVGTGVAFVEAETKNKQFRWTKAGGLGKMPGQRREV